MFKSTNILGIEINEGGHLPYEVTRNKGKSGIWYSHFCLMPQTIAAEILKLNGFDLFDYTTPNSRKLEQAFYQIAYWTKNPQDFSYWNGKPGELGGTTYFSYFEILNSLWPDTNATKLLKSSRPQTARHSAPFMTLTHGEQE